MKKTKAILYAFLAAVFYAINIPVSKILLRDVPETMMAAFFILVPVSASASCLCSISKRKKRRKSLQKMICLLSSA